MSFATGNVNIIKHALKFKVLFLERGRGGGGGGGRWIWNNSFECLVKPMTMWKYHVEYRTLFLLFYTGRSSVSPWRARWRAFIPTWNSGNVVEEEYHRHIGHSSAAVSQPSAPGTLKPSFFLLLNRLIYKMMHIYCNNLLICICY